MKSQKPRHSPALYGSKALQKCKKYKCHNLSHFESCLLTQHIDIIMQRHAEVSCKSVFRNFQKMQFLDFFPDTFAQKKYLLILALLTCTHEFEFATLLIIRVEWILFRFSGWQLEKKNGCPPKKKIRVVQLEFFSKSQP